MKTILITAYAVNPLKGSEDGTGWNLVCEAAKSHPVIVITRKNNQGDIERYRSAHPASYDAQLSFRYFDLPYWMRFWKKGEYLSLLYFYMWQLTLPLFIRKKKLEYDIIHHLNFHNDWTPSFLWLLNKPLVWGPVGHHPIIPSEYLKSYSRQEWMKDRSKWWMKKLFWALDPFLWITKRKASRIITINSQAIPDLRDADKKVLMPAVGCTQIAEAKTTHSGFNVLSIGRFVPLKGFDITVKAFAEFLRRLPEEQRMECKLTLVGKGPCRPLIEEWIREEGIEKNVEIVDWMPRDLLNKIYSGSDVFFFPSHEGAGMVIPEALAFGLPVLCFNNEGPGELVNDQCAIRVPYSNYEQSVQLFADALKTLYTHPSLRMTLAHHALQRAHHTLSWSSKGQLLKDIYVNL